MDASTVAEALKTLRKKHLLVVGDVMLDTYIRGSVARISPEAPVPVVKVERSDLHLGGAANVAANVAALGARVTLIGVVGKDSEARSMQALARSASIRARFVVDSARPTTSKTRVAVDQNHITRLDREETGALTRATELALLRAIHALEDIDMVVVSDYDKGVVGKVLIAALKKKFGTRILADVKPRNAALFSGIHTLKINRLEAEHLFGERIADALVAARAARSLGKRARANIVLTRGGEGITIFDKSTNKVTHAPAVAREVYDVSGAGDSVLAAIASALVAGLPLIEAAHIGNAAGAIAVSRRGTAIVSHADITEVLS